MKASPEGWGASHSPEAGGAGGGLQARALPRTSGKLPGSPGPACGGSCSWGWAPFQASDFSSLVLKSNP